MTLIFSKVLKVAQVIMQNFIKLNARVIVFAKKIDDDAENNTAVAFGSSN